MVCTVFTPHQRDTDISNISSDNHKTITATLVQCLAKGHIQYRSNSRKEKGEEKSAGRRKEKDRGVLQKERKELVSS